MRTLVAGATGQLGRVITMRLLAERGEVDVLVRPGSDYQDLVTAGARPVLGDLKDRATLDRALQEVGAVVTTANATARGGPDTVASVDRHGNANLVDAAAAREVERFLFVSALGASRGHPVPLLAAKGETEDRLKRSTMAWTILRPNLFMDKLIPIVVGERALAGQPVTLVGSGQRRHSFIAMADVAAFAVAALHHADTVRRTLVLTGPDAVTWEDVIHAVEAEWGREVPVRSVPAGRAVHDLPEFVVGLLAALDSYDSPSESDVLTRSLGVPLTPLARWVHRYVADRVLTAT